jgi:hypothetical protein
MHSGIAMELVMQSPVLSLEAGEVVSLDDAAGYRILARCGMVWVTHEDSATDHIVQPGESLVVKKDGRTVVQALQRAWVSIQ